VDVSNSQFGAGGAEVRPQFHGTARSMFPMVMKGLFLSILTLGIYRFWYMTNVRRFLWNNSEIDGDFVEYTGRGVELFIGFLIALAVLIPFYGLIFLGVLWLGPEIGQILNVVSTLGIIVLAQYALFRARRYRLTRTVWRGIRFQQSGSGWTYAWRSLAWALLVIVTLGLAYPFMRASLERYKMSNTFYGDQQGAFAGTGGTLFKRTVLLWLVIVGMLAVMFGAAALFVVPMAQGGDATGGMYGGIITGLLPLLVLVIAVPLYWAVEFRWWADGCSIGPATARCDLGVFAFLKVYLGYIGVVILFSLAVGIVAGGAFWMLHTAGVLNAAQAGPAQWAVIVGMFAAYLVVGLVFAALWQLFGVRPIWRKSLESVAIAGLPALMAAQSSEPEANAFGEGVADALDFGGF